jgi:hypothetical protein
MPSVASLLGLGLGSSRCANRELRADHRGQARQELGPCGSQARKFRGTRPAREAGSSHPAAGRSPERTRLEAAGRATRSRVSPAMPHGRGLPSGERPSLGWAPVRQGRAGLCGGVQERTLPRGAGLAPCRAAALFGGLRGAQPLSPASGPDTKASGREYAGEEDRKQGGTSHGKPNGFAKVRPSSCRSSGERSSPPAYGEAQPGAPPTRADVKYTPDISCHLHIGSGRPPRTPALVRSAAAEPCATSTRALTQATS